VFQFFIEKKSDSDADVPPVAGHPVLCPVRPQVSFALFAGGGDTLVAAATT